MEFNPLDLLASAAELQQQKHDDEGPERIIVTRQRRNNPVNSAQASNNKHVPNIPGGSACQKENREIHNNNNSVKAKAKPSVVIVKKIKLDPSNPELEKMFDEHNYGNAKRTNNNNKYDTCEENGLDLNKCKKRTITDPSSVATSQSYNSEAKTTDGLKCSSDSKPTVVSVDSHSSDSGSSHVKNHSPDCTACGSSDKTEDSCTSCYCSSNGTLNGTCKSENETREVLCGQCMNSACSCKLAHVQTDSRKADKVNIIHCTDKHSGERIMKYNNKQDSSDIVTIEKQVLGNTKAESFKLDDKTGEFITESGARVTVKSVVQEKTINTDKEETTNELTQVKERSSSSDRVVHRMVAVKNAKNLKLDSSSIKSTSIISSAKMPYVKVVPSKDISSEAVIDRKPETVVINISRGRNIVSQLTKSAASSDQSVSQNKTDSQSDSSTIGSCVNVKSSTGNSVGFIKSIVLNEKAGGDNSVIQNADVIKTRSKPVVVTMVSSKTKLEMPNCDSGSFGTNTPSSCGSLKALELTDPVCTDESSTSVHLLSPDRRNPDCVGIVESPVTQSESGDTDKSAITFPFSCKYSEQCGNDSSVIVGEKECKDSGINTNTDENPFITSAEETCTNVTNLTDSALELESGGGSDSISESKELMKESRLDTSDKQASFCDNSANDSITDCEDNEAPIFRFDSDHCYAGAPSCGENVKNEATSLSQVAPTTSSNENESSMHVQHEEVQTPLGSTSELSQDSGYEDVTQSPETEAPPTPATSAQEDTSEKQVMKNLVPVLVSVNSNGSLTLHDTNLTKTLGAPVLTMPDNMTSLNSGIKLIPGTNLASINQPVFLSPVGKSTSPILAEAPRMIQAKPENIIGLISPKKPDSVASLLLQPTTPQISPPKFGTAFKIGTFASFSNKGIMDTTQPVNTSTPAKSLVEDKVKKPATRSRSNSGKSSPAFGDSLSSLVQKVKGNLSQTGTPTSSNQENQEMDHIQHDHDYCTKNLMPSVVSSLLEARLLQKEPLKVKYPHSKTKKSEFDSLKEQHKTDSLKSGKRKRNSLSMTKVDSYDEMDIDSESDTQSIPEPMKSKPRLEKFLEKAGRTTDPKVKITGSSNFQDQFVYFMNTKKRSRRRESKDVPLPLGTDRMFIPPKPGDIIVPHLTDQDIENLKQRSRQCKQAGNMAGYNSLRNEFMAAKYANTQYSGLFNSSSTDTPTNALPAPDDEKSIINTILSMENENLGSPVENDPPSFNESMEMYGQGIGNDSSDIMNLFSEQMNLTPEQMDLLYSAVDEVQNSSPGLIGADKLGTNAPSDPTFGQFPVMTEFPQQQAAASSNKPIDSTAGDSSETVVEPVDTPVSDGLEGTSNPEVPSVSGAATTNAVDSNLGPSQVDAKTADKVDPSGDRTMPTQAIEVEAGEKLASEVDDTTSTAKEAPNKSSSPKADTEPVKTPASPESPVESSPSETPVTTEAVADNVEESPAVNPVQQESGPVLPEPAAPNLVGGQEVDVDAHAVVSELVRTVSGEISSSGVSDASSLDLPSSLTSFSSTGSGNSGVSVPDMPANITDNVLFSPTSLRSSSGSSLGSEIAQSSTTSLPSDIALDILGLDSYKTDLFTDTSVSQASVAPIRNGSLPKAPIPQVPQIPTPVSSTSNMVDYSAPWIVTVSMFWNDLPAIMINNRPFVRLVDIHKQILPAKDTGILKKRCQLMGIKVENSSEMQRYFLVQYGKAFNSKSTLIISQENAKVLIGYYVNPQPKSARADDHKSIIDHRREQLRRIALARRAAMRAQRTSEKKEDPREIKTHDKGQQPAGTTEAASTSVPEVPKPGETVPCAAPKHDGQTTQGVRSQRSTRHKKINFLEMLRGDSGNSADLDASEAQEKKAKSKLNASELAESKKKKNVRERNVKVVHYTIETDSSETDSVEESDYSSSYESDSTTDSEEPSFAQHPPSKQRKLMPPVTLSKSVGRTKVKLVPANKAAFLKNSNSLKVKIGANRSRSASTSTPIAIQVMNKSKSAQLTTPDASPVYGGKVKFRAPASAGIRRSIDAPLVFGKKSGDKTPESVSSSVTYENGVKIDQSPVQSMAIDASSQVVENSTLIDSVNLLSKSVNPGGLEMNENDLKVSPTLPDEILETKESVEIDVSHSEISSESCSKTESNNLAANSETSKEQSSIDLNACEENYQTDFSLLSKHVVSPKLTSGTTDIVQMQQKLTSAVSNEEPLRIIHRDVSPQAQPRNRSQLGEVFVDRYHNKKSVCVRCYTCRKMMTVDSFLRHLHDVVSGMITITTTRTVDIGDKQLNERERKIWETFQRKKELFDNNQIPSPDIVAGGLMYGLDSEDSNHSIPEDGNNDSKNTSGPRIIKTPVSPKNQKVMRKNKTKVILKSPVPTNGNKPTLKKVSPVIESAEGVRSSGRKRKMKQLYPFEEYSYAKFPRLMKNTEKPDDS